LSFMSSNYSTSWLKISYIYLPLCLRVCLYATYRRRKYSKSFFSHWQLCRKRHLPLVSR